MQLMNGGFNMSAARLLYDIITLMAGHTQSSFIRGIRETAPELTENHFNSAKDVKNYTVTTGGHLIRRKGTDVKATFDEIEDITKILPIGSDGIVYMTESNKLYFLKEEGSKFELTLDAYKQFTYSEQGDLVGTLNAKLNQFSNPFSGDYSRQVIDIALKDKAIWAVAESNTKFIITYENNVVVTKPQYMNDNDHTTTFVRHHFYKSEYNKLDNPFYITEGFNYNLGDTFTKLVIDNNADPRYGTCKAWLELDSIVSAGNTIKVDSNEAALTNYLHTPIACNVIPTNIPLLDLATDYADPLSYGADGSVLDNLNDQIDIANTNVTNSLKVSMMSAFLFQRKYVIIPYEIINPFSGAPLKSLDELYVSSAVVTPAVTAINVTPETLSSVSYTLTTTDATGHFGSRVYDQATNRTDLSTTGELISQLPAGETERVYWFPTGIGYNESDSIISDYQSVTPSLSVQGQIKVDGTLNLNLRGLIKSVGLKVFDDTTSTSIERTPYIVIDKDSTLSQQNVDDTNGYLMRVVQGSTTKIFFLNQIGIVAGVGVEFRASPLPIQTGEPNLQTYDEIDFTQPYSVSLSTTTTGITGTFNAITFKEAETSPSSSKAYANCLLIEIGVPSPYLSGTNRRIGGNNYDGNNNIASNVVVGERDPFLYLTTTNDGVGMVTEETLWRQYNFEDGASNNVTGLLNSSISPDFKRISETTAISLNTSIYGSVVVNKLLSELGTTYPNAYLYNTGYGMSDYLISSDYTRTTVPYEYTIFINKTADIIVRGLYTAANDSTIVLASNRGLYEIDFARSTVELRSREEARSQVEAFLNRLVFVSEDGQLIDAQLNFQSIGYKSTSYGRFQRDLLEGAKEIIYSPQQHLFLIIKEDGNLVSVANINNTISGYSRLVIDGFNCENGFEKNGLFYLQGTHQGSKKILALSEGTFEDYRNTSDPIVVESLVESNAFTVATELAPVGHLYRASINKARIFSKNIGSVEMGLGGLNTDTQWFALDEIDALTGRFIKLDDRVNNVQSAKDFDMRLYIRQADTTSNGIIYGFQLEGDIAGIS